MLIKNLKEKMILPIKEIFIDKVVKIRGIDVHLVSITSEDDKNILWIMYELPNVHQLIELDEEREYASNREKMINNISKEMKDHNFHISEMTIQDKKMTFFSSRGRGMYGNPYEGYMQLQHFIEGGMTTTNWDEVNVSNIVIVAYEQREDEDFPEIDSKRELDIKIKVNSEFKRVLINKPITIDFGEKPKGNKYHFYDSINNKKRGFYINKMEHYDIWEDANKKFDSEEIKHLSNNQIEDIKENYFNTLERICPRDMNLAIIEYETEDDIQLNFYPKKYLDKEPVHKKDSSSNMFFKPDKKIGINGFKNRICMIMPVKKDFNDSIDIELFSWYLEKPEEVINV